jgi:hypothetical protein
MEKVTPNILATRIKITNWDTFSKTSQFDDAEALKLIAVVHRPATIRRDMLLKNTKTPGICQHFTEELS